MNTSQREKVFAKTDRAYDFLVEREIAKEAFFVKDLASCVGWKEKSAQTYLSKKWRIFVSKDRNTGAFWVNGLTRLGKKEFRQLHSQAVDYTEKSPEIKKLVDKSKEFALIGVSNYNNPLLKLKTHSFIVNITIAYTSLFHAIFEKNNVEYFHKDRDGKVIIIDSESKSFELIKCCQTYWKDTQSPIKSNIEFLISLRNKIEHRSLPALDLYVEGECQAAITNYENLIVKEFGEKHSLGTSLAISMQLSTFSEKNRIKTLKELQTNNYSVVKNFIDKYRDNLDDEILSSQEYRISVFLVPKLGNHAKSADMCVEFVKQECLTKEQLKEYEKAIVLIKSKKNPYILKPGKVTKLVKCEIPLFSIYLHTKCWKYYKARPRNNKLNHKNEYCGWAEGFDGYLYTQYWVDFLIKQLQKREELNRIRHYR